MIGLSPGIEIPRGDPLSDNHDFSIKFYLAPGVSAGFDVYASQPQYTSWDRTLELFSRREGNDISHQILAGGVESSNSGGIANQLIAFLRSSKDVYFLSLDADRAYPKKTYQPTRWHRPMKLTGIMTNTLEGVHLREQPPFTMNGSNIFSLKKIRLEHDLCKKLAERGDLIIPSHTLKISLNRTLPRFSEYYLTWCLWA
jgi:hypothetical protein